MSEGSDAESFCRDSAKRIAEETGYKVGIAMKEHAYFFNLLSRSFGDDSQEASNGGLDQPKHAILLAYAQATDDFAAATAAV